MKGNTSSGPDVSEAQDTEAGRWPVQSLSGPQREFKANLIIFPDPVSNKK